MRETLRRGESSIFGLQDQCFNKLLEWVRVLVSCSLVRLQLGIGLG